MTDPARPNLATPPASPSQAVPCPVMPDRDWPALPPLASPGRAEPRLPSRASPFPTKTNHAVPAMPLLHLT